MLVKGIVDPEKKELKICVTLYDSVVHRQFGGLRCGFMSCVC